MDIFYIVSFGITIGLGIFGIGYIGFKFPSFLIACCLLGSLIYYILDGLGNAL